MLSAEIDKIGGQSRTRIRKREPENEMAYILPYPFDMPEEDHKKVIKRIGGFRIGRVIMCNRDKVGKGFWDYVSSFISKTAIPFLLEQAINLFTNDKEQAKEITNLITPFIEILGKDGIEFIIKNASKGLDWIINKLKIKAKTVNKLENKLMEKLKKTKKGKGKKGGNIMLTDFIMKHHKRLGRGFNESFMDGLLWTTKKIISPIANIVLPPVIGTAVSKGFDVLPQYLAERMPGDYEYHDPSKPDAKKIARQQAEERFKRYYEATVQKPREAHEEKASLATTRTAGKIFDKNKSFWENHLEPLADPLMEIGKAAIGDYIQGKLWGRPSVVQGIIDDVRRPRPPRGQPRGQPPKAPIRASSDEESKMEILPIAYPVQKVPTQPQSTQLIKPSAYSRPGLALSYRASMPNKGKAAEYFSPEDKAKFERLYSEDERKELMSGVKRPEKITVAKRGPQPFSEFDFSSFPQTPVLSVAEHRAMFNKPLKPAPIGESIFLETPPQERRRLEQQQPKPTIFQPSIVKSSQSFLRPKEYPELYIAPSPATPLMSRQPTPARSRSSSFLYDMPEQNLSFVRAHESAIPTRLGTIASRQSARNLELERAILDAEEAVRKYDTKRSITGLSKKKGGGSCCRSCKMKKGKCRNGRGWWDDHKGKILGALSGAATLGSMAYAANQLYGNSSKGSSAIPDIGQSDYNPAKYSHLDVGYEDV